MLENASTLAFVKDFTGAGATRYFLKGDDALKEVTADVLRDIDEYIICHDFWLIKEELAKADCLPKKIFDLDEVYSTVSQKRNLREQRDQQGISLKIPYSIISKEELDAYLEVIERRSPVDISVIEAGCNALADYAKMLIFVADNNDELARLSQIELPIFQMLAAHSSLGIGIDVERVRVARELVQFDFYTALKNFSAEFNIQPDVMRDDQLRDYLLEKGYDLSDISLDYIIEYIPLDGDFGIKLQELRKLRDTNSILNDLSLSEGLVFPIVDVFGTRTSRIIYRNPSLQNLSKKYRNVIVPLAGKSLGYVDYDQFEVGIMAALSGDQCLKDLYESGDMYVLFAEKYLKIEGFRKQAKLLFLSYAYGMSRKSVVDAAVELGASRANAKEAFKSFQTYEAWKTSKETEFDSTGRAATLIGNYIIGEGQKPFSRKEKRSMISQSVQGAGSLIFKKAILQLSNTQDFRLVLPMHDAMLFEYSDDATPMIVVQHMEEAMTSVLGGNIKGKASISDFFEI